MPLLILLVLVTLIAGATPAAAAPPGNDTSAAATVIGALPYETEVDTTEATLGDDDSAIACGTDPGTQTFSHSVWFAYTPSEDQTIAIDTSASSYPVAGAVFPAGAPGTPVACFLGSTLVPLTGGTTYLIDLVEIGDAGGGTLRLSITEVDIPEPELTLAPVGRVDRAGTATLEGTLTCDPGTSFVWLNATYTQVIGRRTAVNAFGELFGEEFVCDGTPQPWSVALTSFQGPLTPGPGSATVFVSACRELCGSAEVTASVVLRRSP
jgi:hypothetical protein